LEGNKEKEKKKKYPKNLNLFHSFFLKLIYSKKFKIFMFPNKFLEKKLKKN